MTVGLVVSGAGARGAYEAGALSVLVPWLARRGETPRILVGTSAGAISAVLLAPLLATDPEGAARAVVEGWRALDRAAVFRSVLLGAPVTLLRYLATVARVDHWTGAGAELDGLLDVTPLRRRLERHPYWADVHACVARGDLTAIAAVTTSVARGRTDVFVDAAPGTPLPPDDPSRDVLYRPDVLGPRHVLASAAIPVLFPPVAIPEPDGTPGWHLDGGVRLNTPVGPALDLGADRLVIVATHPLDAAPAADENPKAPPDVFTSAAAVLMSALVDRMIDDVRELDRVNRLVGRDGERAGYRAVPYLFVGPRRRGELAAAARDVLERRYDGPGGLTGGDLTALTALVGGPRARHAELLSFLLFDREYLGTLVELGRQDARAALADAGDDPWRLTRVRPA